MVAIREWGTINAERTIIILALGMCDKNKYLF